MLLKSLVQCSETVYQERSVGSNDCGENQTIEQVEIKVDDPSWSWYSTFTASTHTTRSLRHTNTK